MRDLNANVDKRERGTSGLPTKGRRLTNLHVARSTVRHCSFEAVLLAIASHDLRQPLQVIQSTYDRLGGDARTPTELRILKSGQDAIDRLRDQLVQLTNALALGQGKKKVALKRVRIAELLESARRENQEFAATKDVQIRLVASDTVVLSDSLLLRSALRNLVNNAIKYTPKGGRILLGCRRRGRQVRIDVLDNGIGIRSEHVSRIFEAFCRIDRMRQDGFGIGLFIVKQIMDILGHRIEVASNPSHGSRFSVFATLAIDAQERRLPRQQGQGC